MKTAFVTRFSYFGRSGWKSDFSADPDQLFAPDRLEQRLAMFEQITLQSLVDQTDPEFDHIAISSSLMPQVYQDRLTQLMHDMLGDRAKVVFREPNRMGRVLHQTTVEHYGDEPWITQVVLDDDDAVSNDFVSICKYEANQVTDVPYCDDTFHYLSFPHGATLNLRNQGKPWMSARYEPWTNLGLSIVKQPHELKNIFNISHRFVGARFPSRLIGAQRPFYIRTIHDCNDSKARHKTGDALETLRGYFPLLKSFFDADAPHPPVAKPSEKALQKEAA